MKGRFGHLITLLHPADGISIGHEIGHLNMKHASNANPLRYLCPVQPLQPNPRLCATPLPQLPSCRKSKLEPQQHNTSSFLYSKYPSKPGHINRKPYQDLPEHPSNPLAKIAFKWRHHKTRITLNFHYVLARCSPPFWVPFVVHDSIWKGCVRGESADFT